MLPRTVLALASLAIIGLLSALLHTTPSPAAAGLYFNSSEPGCDGSDPSVLMCDDFEVQGWYGLNCDQANTSGGLLQVKGWCGNVFAAISPPGAARCGGQGAAGTSCTATSGQHSGGGGQANSANHHFSGNRAVSELWARFYHKLLPGYVIGHEKVLFFQSDSSQCCLYMFPWGGPTDMQVESGAETRRLSQNQGNTLEMIAGRWYYVEVHIRMNTTGQPNGVYELWMDDCGTNGLGCTGTGTLRARYTDVRGMSDQGPTVNQVWLENWSPVEFPTSGEAFYDQLVVATRRIGPMRIGGGAPPSPPTNVQVR